MERGILFLVAIFTLTGCSLIGKNEEPPQKSSHFNYQVPAKPFQRAGAGSADIAWRSQNTGGTILVNSACYENTSPPLKNQVSTILEGVDNVKIQNEKKIEVNKNEAIRVRAQGQSGDAVIMVELVGIKNGKCHYDLAYITKEPHFVEELSHFDQFINNFVVLQ